MQRGRTKGGKVAKNLGLSSMDRNMPATWGGGGSSTLAGLSTGKFSVGHKQNSSCLSAAARGSWNVGAEDGSKDRGQTI
jgi:hypothetical protein